MMNYEYSSIVWVDQVTRVTKTSLIVTEAAGVILSENKQTLRV